jgi:hypothetical protein
MRIDKSLLCQTGTASAAQTQPLASGTAAHINGPAKMNSNSTLQQIERTVNNAPAASQQPRAAASQPPSVANRVSSPAVAAAGVSASTAGNGLTDQERETAQHVLNALSKHREADPFRGPVDWEALVRAAATAWR